MPDQFIPGGYLGYPYIPQQAPYAMAWEPIPFLPYPQRLAAPQFPAYPQMIPYIDTLGPWSMQPPYPYPYPQMAPAGIYPQAASYNPAMQQPAMYDPYMYPSQYDPMQQGANVQQPIQPQQQPYQAQQQPYQAQQPNTAYWSDPYVGVQANPAPTYQAQSAEHAQGSQNPQYLEINQMPDIPIEAKRAVSAQAGRLAKQKAAERTDAPQQAMDGQKYVQVQSSQQKPASRQQEQSQQRATAQMPGNPRAKESARQQGQQPAITPQNNAKTVAAAQNAGSANMQQAANKSSAVTQQAVSSSAAVAQQRAAKKQNAADAAITAASKTVQVPAQSQGSQVSQQEFQQQLQQRHESLQRAAAQISGQTLGSFPKNAKASENSQAQRGQQDNAAAKGPGAQNQIEKSAAVLKEAAASSNATSGKGKSAFGMKDASIAPKNASGKSAKSSSTQPATPADKAKGAEGRVPAASDKPSALPKSNADSQAEEPTRAVSPLGIASLICGILALALIAASLFVTVLALAAFVMGIIAAILGITGIAMGRNYPELKKGLAIGGLVLGIVAIVGVIPAQIAWNSFAGADDQAFSSKEMPLFGFGSKNSDESQDGESESNGESSSPSSSSSSSESAESSGDKGSQDGFNNLNIGTAASYPNGLSIQVDSVDAALKDSKGDPIVCVTVTYSNRTRSNINFNAFDWKAESGDGSLKAYTVYMDGKDELNSGELSVGGTVTGNIYFTGPIRKVIFESNYWSGDGNASWVV